jgi:phage shock protein C
MEPRRKLYRSRANRTIAGVCCGLADYFGVDPTLIRVIFVVLNVLGGAGIVLYLLLWLLMPAGDSSEAAGDDIIGSGLRSMGADLTRMGGQL